QTPTQCRSPTLGHVGPCWQQFTDRRRTAPRGIADPYELGPAYLTRCRSPDVICQTRAPPRAAVFLMQSKITPRAVVGCTAAERGGHYAEGASRSGESAQRTGGNNHGCDDQRRADAPPGQLRKG